MAPKKKTFALDYASFPSAVQINILPERWLYSPLDPVNLKFNAVQPRQGIPHMKIYESHTAPNPRRVRIFLAEKGIDMDYVQLDIAKGDNMSGAMRTKNPSGKVPFLELDDGTCIGETMAICRYFEETQAEPRLMGNNPLEKAQVEMWQRTVEFYFLHNVIMCFQHTSGYFKDRMTPIADYGVTAGQSAETFLNTLEQRLGNYTYMAGEYFSVADITLLCALDFARVVKIKLGDQHPNIQRWYQRVNSRPSSKA